MNRPGALKGSEEESNALVPFVPAAGEDATLAQTEAPARATLRVPACLRKVRPFKSTLMAPLFSFRESSLK
jgi:hypothetical protein